MMAPAVRNLLFGGLVCTSALLAVNSLANAASVTLSVTKDNTILNDPDGGNSKSNGQGPLFVGTLNRSPYYRRALVQFDVASSLPAGALIDSVELRLQLTAAEPDPNDTTISLHRLLADWGEGASFAVGGTGAAAEPGDATWQYRFFNASSWTTLGGDFFASASGSAIIDRLQGSKTWNSTPGLVADAQSWIDHPENNFGWILKGSESDWGATRRFDSGEILDGTERANIFPQITVPYMAPQLTIEYTPVPELAALKLAILASLLILRLPKIARNSNSQNA
jgi:hypothetical protein